MQRSSAPRNLREHLSRYSWQQAVLDSEERRARRPGARPSRSYCTRHEVEANVRTPVCSVNGMLRVSKNLCQQRVEDASTGGVSPVRRRRRRENESRERRHDDVEGDRLSSVEVFAVWVNLSITGATPGTRPGQPEGEPGEWHQDSWTFRE